MKNEYLPYPARIEAIQEEGPDTRTLRVRFTDQRVADSFDYKPGQFAEVSLFGIGEAPMSITSPPSRKGFLEFTIRDAGKVTHAIHGLDVGDILWVRGPYGNFFPYDEIKGKNIYFVAGGIGLAALRSLINMVFDHWEDFRHIKVLYGSKTPEELCFKGELEEWKKIPDTEVWLTVDNPCEGWEFCIGVVTELWKETDVDPGNAVAVVCGPPVMMKFVALELVRSGFKEKDILMTLERYMKCGIGKCGHCNIGEKFVCLDGPVFTYEEIRRFPEKENVF